MKTGELLPPVTLAERVEMSRRLLQKAVEWKGERLGVVETRRHYSNYFKGIPNFKEYRMKLVTQDDYAELLGTFEEIINNFSEELTPV
jgi:tRNA-dihydrouridine synthase